MDSRARTPRRICLDVSHLYRDRINSVHPHGPVKLPLIAHDGDVAIVCQNALTVMNAVRDKNCNLWVRTAFQQCFGERPQIYRHAILDDLASKQLHEEEVHSQCSRSCPAWERTRYIEASPPSYLGPVCMQVSR